ncbi:hypothetical protein A2999_01200 [Candidatus Wolfebacteria bacterium RIFCSPLOWO2_01_FULL_38_11]|uniref:Spore protein YkvP/CgeB glycosyl transferase-like domain-containing protein n=2 Tax=Candidatus Wolfeibacteriota TaxID=1752735 RepID=A0A0G0FUL1_9BACT|nr:MAG: hypothetical protein US36_C0007G0036 [Candidatus Wolfebacteria bacterium GW2011_GWC1_37_10]OGM91136.1 MAG: hypothetical protein A2999_01200 [Candidatus Wolfebacteria bacterium RIFCSPLOWO2_01_FULL_38_11]
MLKRENKKLKIFIVGDFHSKIHEQALYEAFLKLGYETDKFSWHDYFGGFLFRNPETEKHPLKLIYYKTQNKFIFGPVVWKINKDLIACIKMEKPDLVFIYSGNLIFTETIKQIKKSGATIFGYNNDDPFSKKHPFYMWRHFLKAILYYDHIFAYRQKNLSDYKKIGYNRVSLLRAYYIKERNFFIANLPANKYVCDVIFAGHWENDGRDEYIKAIIEAGINFKLYGPEWRRSKYYNFFRNKLGYEINSLKDDYNLSLNSAKIALVFLSKLNNDTYTRRCFEITAAKTFMLSEYTDDLNSIFKQGEEAEYFGTKEEMLQKIKYYLEHNEERERIASGGYQRLLKDRHEVLDRVKEILKVYQSYILR